MSLSTLKVLIAAEPGRLLSVAFCPQESVCLILGRIAHRLKEDSYSDQDHALFVNGIPITDLQKPLSDYNIFGSCLVYHSLKEGEWAIHVATSHGHSIDVNYNPNDTIRQVKMKVYARLWIHPDIQKIFLGDRELGDDKILGDHKIQSGSALSIAPYHSGGGTVPFPEILIPDALDTDTFNFMFTYNEIAGRRACNGANIECDCECTPGHRVICPRGYGFIEITHTTLQCRNCNRMNEDVLPFTVGFVNCKYRLHGIRDATEEQCTSDWKIVKPEASYELLKDGNQTHWRRVVIETVSLDELGDCIVCLKFMNNGKQLACGHQFHETCFVAWGSTCPVCPFKQTLG